MSTETPDIFTPPEGRHHWIFANIAKHDFRGCNGDMSQFLAGLHDVMHELKTRFRDMPCDDHYDWIVRMIDGVKNQFKEAGYGHFNLGNLQELLQKAIEKPVESGDIPCKAVRDECLEIGFIVQCIYLRSEGYVVATPEGFGLYKAIARYNAA